VSVAFTEPTTDRFRFRELGLRLTENRIEDAITSLRLWTDRIEQRFRIDFRFRIEENEEDLFQFLGGKTSFVGRRYTSDQTKVNSRAREYQGEAAVNRVLREYRSQVDELDERFGYSTPQIPLQEAAP